MERHIRCHFSFDVLVPSYLPSLPLVGGCACRNTVVRVGKGTSSVLLRRRQGEYPFPYYRVVVLCVNTFCDGPFLFVRTFSVDANRRYLGCYVSRTMGPFAMPTSRMGTVMVVGHSTSSSVSFSVRGPGDDYFKVARGDFPPFWDFFGFVYGGHFIRNFLEVAQRGPTSTFVLLSVVPFTSGPPTLVDRFGSHALFGPLEGPLRQFLHCRKVTVLGLVLVFGDYGWFSDFARVSARSFY